MGKVEKITELANKALKETDAVAKQKLVEECIALFDKADMRAYMTSRLMSQTSNSGTNWIIKCILTADIGTL